MDLRIVKTKKAIINAFLALRAKRPPQIIIPFITCFLFIGLASVGM